ncbi:MAG: twin-arginine translocase subunit TatB [Gammaproteobacteria bacterium]|nr:twin-arginine translocase subunit TatB [Gammaproteobacteria bacterium]MCP5424440.1 twin-arginine translocase subunit TatB [Gammaproteobacteria bacterium]MCP5458434.1 twin-arginine translocase subunit TatB [Gammaproteobacteria bacterium]
MFDIGFWEVFLLFIVGLVVVGPERLPTLARTAALWISKARRLVNEVRDEVERELQVEDIKRSISQQAPLDEIKQLANRVNAINSDLKAEARNITQDLASGSTPSSSLPTNGAPSLSKPASNAEMK